MIAEDSKRRQKVCSGSTETDLAVAGSWAALSSENSSGSMGTSWSLTQTKAETEISAASGEASSGGDAVAKKLSRGRGTKEQGEGTGVGKGRLDGKSADFLTRGGGGGGRKPGGGGGLRAGLIAGKHNEGLSDGLGK